jgi:hypothetical protein
MALALALFALTLGSAGQAQEQPVGETVPYLSIDPNQGGARLQVNFPAQANGDVNRLLYRLNGADNLDVDVQVFAGRGEVGFPIVLFVALLVDGHQAKFRLNGAGTSTTHPLTLPSPGTVVHAALSLAGQRLSAGLHNIDLLLWRTDGIPFPCWSFLALKGAPATLPSPSSDVFARSGVGRRPVAEFQLSSSSEPLFGPLRKVAPSALASLSLRAHLERSERDQEPLELAVTALLDGAQVGFRGSGATPRVMLDPGQIADAELSVAALPAQSTGHRLIFFLLRRPSIENLNAFLTIQFSPTRQLGGIKW